MFHGKEKKLFKDIETILNQTFILFTSKDLVGPTTTVKGKGFTTISAAFRRHERNKKAHYHTLLLLQGLESYHSIWGEKGQLRKEEKEEKE